MKLDRRTNEKNLKARVSAIIEELGLGQCANTRIGAGGENGKVTYIDCLKYKFIYRGT